MARAPWQSVAGALRCSSCAEAEIFEAFAATGRAAGCPTRRCASSPSATWSCSTSTAPDPDGAPVRRASRGRARRRGRAHVVGQLRVGRLRDRARARLAGGDGHRQGIAVRARRRPRARPASCSTSPCPPPAGGTTSPTPERRCGSLRSEEAAEGETVPLRTLAALARDWYGDRLDLAGGRGAPRSPSGSSAPTASRAPSGGSADYQLGRLPRLVEPDSKNASSCWPLSASASAMKSAVVTLPWRFSAYHVQDHREERSRRRPSRAAPAASCRRGVGRGDRVLRAPCARRVVQVGDPLAWRRRRRTSAVRLRRRCARVHPLREAARSPR